MADGGRTKKEGAKRSRGRGRPARRPSSGGGGGAIQAIVGLALALAVFGIIYAVMKQSGLGDKTYMNAYINCIGEIRRSETMTPDEVWDKVHSLPSQEIRDPKLKELHQTLIEYATVIRDPKDYTQRGGEIEARLERLELEAAQRLGVQIKVK